ncbi:DNA binding protein [Arthrobacter phage Kuleana]|uniref:Helix-turn-helix DNA-binding domain protein n=1 Tax=Arthrobacter phage Kuleana TaxID=2653270 RepID=A0A5Q2WC31_9CAUD|nr:DNA binding protein [Arthrobacter phage Kuleana]QGH74531.1 helix-turn-helix DNA-binding domain protein [Arthrobacter phage Kuleana]
MKTNKQEESNMKARKAAARRTDPGTSHAAAATISPRKMSTIRSRVLAILNGRRALEAGGLTHDEIIAEYKGYSLRLGWPRATDSSIRTRCKELWRDGEVVKVEDSAGKSGMGNAAILWRAAGVQSIETGGDKEETA